MLLFVTPVFLTPCTGDEMGMENTDARGIVRMTEHQVSVSSDLDFSLELEEVVEEEMTPEQVRDPCHL